MADAIERRYERQTKAMETKTTTPGVRQSQGPDGKTIVRNVSVEDLFQGDVKKIVVGMKPGARG